MFKINPKWLEYNNLMNEGGEGYNPHKKWLSDVVEAKKEVKDDLYYTFVKDMQGRDIRASEAKKRLEKEKATMARITDACAIKLTQEAIDFYTKQLEGIK